MLKKLFSVSKVIFLIRIIGYLFLADFGLAKMVKNN